MPGVLLRALSEYKFVGTPLWRMSDGKDLVRVELTFHKALPTKPYYKKRAESRRQPAPSAGEWLRQPAAATRPPTTTRSTPARRQPAMEREMPPPPTQTLPDTTRQHITHDRTQKTATIQPSPIITRPATPPPSPESPPTKKPRTKSPATKTAPTHYFHVDIEEEYPLHEKYDLQDVTSTKYKVIAKAQRLPRDDEEINVDLPVYFVFHRDNQHWTLIKGPTSKFYDEIWYGYIEELYKRGTKQRNSAYWYDTLTSFSDPFGGGGGPPLIRLVPPSYLGMTYS